MFEAFGTLQLSCGMRMEADPEGGCALEVGNGSGRGYMRTLPLSPHAFVAMVDFELDVCPIIVSESQLQERWMALDYCQEGRCEVAMPGESAIVVKPGDCCLSVSKRLPDEYRYPLGRYRGIKAFFSTKVTDDPAFSLLREADPFLDGWADQLNLAVLFEDDAQLNALMEALGAATSPFDALACKLRFMEIALHIRTQGLPARNAHSYFTKSQMRIARAVHDRLCDNLGRDYSLQDMARGFGISVTSLNNYFKGIYGAPVPTYVRERRMDAAAEALIRTDASVSTVASQVGYANPSKFSAAFKHRFGVTPTEYRRQTQANL